ncbi:mannose-6-phosphate isomerase, class I [Sanguibacter hominis ATCC BAA-789]|uniref:mannose-6-phosphate isomerase n=1 Tax=Sanguibacter hominis ATCC BAA-789 TaxID=1312740 RepID=A0A9X5FGC0_9MICO|nr:mannose-6-phosphate isomerase, class I [Sanguibacter hominis]NKX93586.1 mannose-6-phosphate isomerase, class I [Sanguibacter hominis ATCC BAA-789]
MYRLTNAVKYYDWGSTTAIPGFLGTEPDGRPVAEVWMGAHPSGPSWAAGRSLLEMIESEPAEMLGERVVGEHGPRLPFLFKILAASRPLSLQVHPNRAQAIEGFARENAAEVPLAMRERSFHDDQHKPEMLLALTRFEGLCGFRSPRRVLELLEPLGGPLAETIRTALLADPSARGTQAAFEGVLEARGSVAPSDIEETVKGCEAQLVTGFGDHRAYGTVVALAHWYPGDPGAVASLMLNRFTLEPGESAFVGAGVVHAYLAGLGLETMASSDNVLRAGLTHKKIDVAALLECTVYDDSPVVRPVPVPGRGGQPATIRAEAREFALALAAPARAGGPQYVTQDGPRVAVCTRGSLGLRAADGSELALTKGESVFVPHSAGRLEVRGDGEAVVVFVP